MEIKLKDIVGLTKKFNHKILKKTISDDDFSKVKARLKSFDKAKKKTFKLMQLLKTSNFNEGKEASEILRNLYYELSNIEDSIASVSRLIKDTLINYESLYKDSHNNSTELTNLIKVNEVELKNQEASILENTYGFIIINSNNGITILNNDFAIIKSIFLVNHLNLDRKIFKKFDGTEILLYSSEDNYFILVNLVDFSQKLIQLPELITQQNLSSIYFWNNNYVIISDYSHKKLFKICLNSSRFHVMSERELKLDHTLFYDYWTKAKEFLTYEISGNTTYVISDIPYAYPAELKLIFRNYEKEEIGCYDFLTNKTVTVNKFNPDYYEFAYSNEKFLLAQGRELYLIKKNIIMAQLILDEGSEIIGASFLKEYDTRFIVVLSRDLNKRINNKLTLYEVASPNRIG